MNIVKFRSAVAAASILVLATVAIAFTPQQAPSSAPPGDAPPRQPGGGRPGGDRGPGQPGAQQGRPANIGGSMKSINRAYKRLREQITDPAKKAENLQLINEMERGTVISKGLPLPADVLETAKDEAAKAKMNDTFRLDLMKSLRIMLDIEDDIFADKGDAAKVKLENLIKMQEESHKRLGVKVDEDER